MISPSKLRLKKSLARDNASIYIVDNHNMVKANSL